MRRGIRIRWWLSLAFALIAAVTAVAVSQVFALRSEEAFRERAQELAPGNALQAAIELARAEERGRLVAALATIASDHRLALFIYSADGELVSASRSRNTNVNAIHSRREAVDTALAGRRFVRANNRVRATTVALPFRVGNNGALLAFAYHPDLAAGLGILRREIVIAALWAVLLGGAIGFLVASLIAARLGRIARAAAAIEGGNLETPLRAGFGDEVGVLGATIESMRRRLGESFRSLASERDRIARLVERLAEGVLSVHADLTVELANAEARRLLGTPRLRAGERMPDPYPAFPLEHFVASLFVPDAGPRERQVAIDDRTLAIAGLPPTEGSETAIVVLADVSERERRERAEREFVANAAHELRTPLTTIVGAVEALQAGAKHDPEHRERFIEHIEREAGRLARLTRALLVLARAQTHQEEPRRTAVPARPLLEDVRANMRPADDVAVHLDCGPDVVLCADPDLAEEALANLAANAVRHTSHGRIVLAARTLDDEWAELEVSDTGPGIAAGEHERIFDRFYRTNGRDAEGFGLGLSIVREAVTALGGTVEIQSAPGRGTRARMKIPSAARRQA
jgi:signal transduction histidine kinase/HAMP domain-containing protein